MRHLFDYFVIAEMIVLSLLFIIGHASLELEFELKVCSKEPKVVFWRVIRLVVCQLCPVPYLSNALLTVRNSLLQCRIIRE